MSTRVTSRSTADSYQISIASKKIWQTLLFLPIWFAGWTVGGVLAIRSLLHPGFFRFQLPDLFMAVWLVFWTAAEVWAAYALLRNAFGKELATVGDGNLILKMDILGYGRSKVFPVSQVSNLRARGLFGSALQRSSGTWMWGLGGGVIAFESGGKTHRFGMWLEENEAQEVVARLAEHLPMPRPDPR